MDWEGKITAPWTQSQVEALNFYQESGIMHPFTCGTKSSHGGGRLIATTYGWICSECDYTQDWAHAFMANREFLEAEVNSRKAWFRQAAKLPRPE